MRPQLPSIILIGGPFTTERGEHFDSRQPFDDDPLSAIPLKALASSELWWNATASVVLPLLDAAGDDTVAAAGGPRTLIYPSPNGPALRRRLSTVLPGGKQSKKRPSRWRFVDMSQLWEPLDAPVVVDTWGWYWLNAASAYDYTHFEKTWLANGDLTIVAPHTHAAITYLDGYTRWVADGRPAHVSGPALPRYDWDLSISPVIPIDSDFRVTAMIQDGAWVDPAPLDAARRLLQARFDLKIGIWDLATNHTLRATLLQETPAAAVPEMPAVKPESVSEREQQRLAERTPEQIEAANARAAAAANIARLDDAGWTNTLAGVSGDIDPADPFRRSLPLAIGPQCTPQQAWQRHPAWRPGTPFLWLHASLHPAGDHFVALIVPPPLSINHRWAISQFFHDHEDDFRHANSPQPYSLHTRFQNNVEAHMMATFERIDPTDWDARIDFIIKTTPAWTAALTPLVEICLNFIADDPLGMIREPQPDWMPPDWRT